MTRCPATTARRPVARLRSSTRRGGMAGAAPPRPDWPVWPAGGAGAAGAPAAPPASSPTRPTRRRLAGRARALRGARIHLVRNPRRIGREVRVGRVVHRHVRASLEVADVQDGLRLGRDGVGELQRVGQPRAIARQFLPADAAPLRVVVDGERLPYRVLRLGCRGWRGRLRRWRRRLGGHQRGRAPERDRHGDGGSERPVVREQGSRNAGDHADSFDGVTAGAVRDAGHSTAPLARSHADSRAIPTNAASAVRRLGRSAASGNQRAGLVCLSPRAAAPCARPRTPPARLRPRRCSTRRDAGGSTRW